MKRRHFLQAAAVTAAGAALAQNSPPRRLLVLGGTGFLGRHVVDAALARHFQVTLFHRNAEKNALYPQVRHLLGDRDQGFPSFEGGEFDFVIDTSGQKPAGSKTPLGPYRAAATSLFRPSPSIKTRPTP